MAEIADVQEPVVEHAMKTGWLCRRLRMINRRGFPDYTFLKNGITIFIEFKDIDGKLEMLQEKEIAKLRRFGMKVFVVDSLEEGIAILDSAM